jgi:hypothetical protein
LTLLGLFAFGFLWCFGGSNEESDPTPRLNAAARVDNAQLHLTNNDPFPWTDCSVELNSGTIRAGWSQNVGRIPAGETVSSGLMAFTRSGGERFNSFTHAVESIHVDCNTLGGRRLWSGRFR